MHNRIGVIRRPLDERINEFKRPFEEFKLAQQRNRLEEFVSDRAIDIIYHFTPVQNLPSICAHGLLNRTQVRRLRNPVVVLLDEYRIDGADWAICCSVEWPNYKMLCRKEQYYDLQFAVLALDASILWELDCVFLPGNAARADLRNHISQLRTDRFNRLNQLKALFPDPDNRRLLWRSYPQDVQAEVLVAESPIPLQYCQFVYFKYFADFRTAQHLPWPPHVKCEQYPEIFRARPDLRRR